MPALPPFVAPVAVVVTFAVCVAWAVSAPPIERSGPVPTDALVVTFESEIATWAERAMLPLPAEAPPSAVVVIVSVSVDVSVRFLAPVSVAPFGQARARRLVDDVQRERGADAGRAAVARLLRVCDRVVGEVRPRR